MIGRKTETNANNPRATAREHPPESQRYKGKGKNLHRVHARIATVKDAAAIARIYNQGIEDRIATYETELRSVEDQQAWLRAIDGRYPAVVAEIDGEVVGWAGAGPYRMRECYRGIGEFSMYVQRDWRGRGVGDLLLASLIREAELLGLWKLLSRIFPFNEASLALCRKHGFREVGIYEKHARLDRRWLDVVIVERLIRGNVNVASARKLSRGRSHSVHRTGVNRTAIG